MPAVAEPPVKQVAAPRKTTQLIVHEHRRHLPKWICWIAAAALLAAAGWYWRSYSQNKISFETAATRPRMTTFPSAICRRSLPRRKPHHG